MAEGAGDGRAGANAELVFAATRPSRDQLTIATSSGTPVSRLTGRDLTIYTAKALDRGELPRMRVFGMFGVGAACGAVLLTLVMGGDPIALALFRAGAAVIVVSNVWLIWLAKSEARWRPAHAATVWIVATIGLWPALVYFGPFSGVVVAPMLGIAIVALGRSLRVAVAVTVIAIGGHVALALPIAFGWISDRGLLRLVDTELPDLLMSEALLVVFLASGFALGRWIRHTNVAAAVALQNAMALIGEQQVLLEEVRDDAARARGAGEGKWTGEIVGRFRVGLVLGRGGMGEVYEATTSDGSVVAMKLLHARALVDAELQERFRREMAVASRLESPHIVRVLELSPQSASQPYIVMERLHGRDLASRLRVDGRLAIAEIEALLDQISDGLEVARLAGIVHRDLKPHNLFAHEPGDVAIWKILDFGVAKLASESATLTGGGVVGTPHYMAPEQASGKDVAHAADVYALGAIAYRCLTGRLPFVGATLAELVYKVVHTRPERPSSFGRSTALLDSVLAGAMAKEPKQRFESARHFARAFCAASRGEPATHDPPHDLWK